MRDEHFNKYLFTQARSVLFLSFLVDLSTGTHTHPHSLFCTIWKQTSGKWCTKSSQFCTTEETTCLFVGVCFWILHLQVCHIEVLVDDLGDGLDLCAQLLLNAVQGEAVVVGDQVDGDAQVAEAPGPADPVQVCLRHLGEVEVDHHIHRLDVYAPREQVGAD
uniref:Putative secreted protein n=1 Tax=Ixodes ricinus TaxID=34613 RepID=A0A6B0UWV9_IXORI